MQARETLGSRLGFLLLSAGCAIGLGNIWRFPYIAGEYGGAVFIAAYLVFLVAVGLPILIMEIALGRASKQNMGKAFHVLEPKGSKWHKIGWFSLVGSYFLLMFYTPVAGWLAAYCYHMSAGALAGLNPDQVGTFFNTMLVQPLPMFGWTVLVIAIGFIVCAFGVRNGVERVVKYFMLALLFLMVLLAINSLMLPGSSKGLAFLFAPDWGKAKELGVWNLLSDAMNQAFFTLSVGIGSMLIFGSYLNNKRTITGEAVYILGLDTFVAIMAGVIIFPACFTFNIPVDQGPSLLFVTLPNVFNLMSGGRFWGLLFFVFLTFAAFTTVIAVLENIISYCMDVYGWNRKKALIVNSIALVFLSLPCILGYNLLSFIEPLGPETTILDFEDFIITQNLLPIGSFIILLFCTWRYGWGFDKFVEETDTGVGPKFPRWTRVYLTYILPVIILVIYLQGLFNKIIID